MAKFANENPAYPVLIRNIWAVGRNFSEHAKELANPVPAPEGDPMIFLKAGSSAVPSEELGGEGFCLPSFTDDIHHEAEIAFQFGPGPAFQFTGIGFALDLTAREVQSRLKSQQHPWTLAKSFRAACPLSEIRSIPAGWNLSEVRFSLMVNDEIRQNGHLKDMIFDAERLRTFVVERFPVVAGDLLLTGTPKGVGALKPGDRIQGTVLSPSGEAFLKTTWQVLR